MPISRRIKFVCKLLFQVGLAAGLLFIFSGCGKSHFVFPDFNLTEEKKPEEIIVKETIPEKVPSSQFLTEEGAEKERDPATEESSEAEEEQMASEKLGNFGARQGFSSFESEMSPVKDEGPPILSQDNTVSTVDEADSRFTSAETSDATVAAIPSPEKDQENSLSKIHFKFNESILTSEALDILAKNVEILEKNKNLRLEIEGHCDSVGSRDYNQDLGQARANAVKDFLVNNGIESSRLKAISHGKDLLLCHDEVETCQKQNRRVELVKID